ncbi:MAG: nicotinate phosphoribosyltransferase [Candidatus Latescibacteria bacterium]|nr:nicotinate phosphoribosyltransferase [Candidatus Latescibacterota bacterium]NIM64520.1 nicotinate phosphoribosyltransferase [Candidatus Latescibacterota bacterium]NIO00673.1 nicotinate phosphoribosyltransferase [Candidatus Latescibacterota bacterium]NIO27076.1 nicotinate phosphoribosyltransferase [Candidatus Latescibacterota bacterium]NIO54600.1 nicotinate phosphoribosyltransferase [Candidatus Latescibacterota bacterium]
MKFHIATEREILKGKVTDVYFKRALGALGLSGKDQEVVMEVTTNTFPEGFGWGVLAGVDEVIELLKGKKCDMAALPEGSLFHPMEPVLSVKGLYSEIAVYETAILGLLSQASGIATKAAHFRIASRGKALLSFGARRIHPVLGPLIDRSAYIGGFDGVALIASAERLELQPSGTIPHALILLIGDTAEAFDMFNQSVEKGIPRIALVDTFGDEKVETVKLARKFSRVLDGVRIDTPTSRRGNLRAIVEEIRWELSVIGCEHVKIYVSGGLDVSDVEELAPCVDGFGIGTSLSNAHVVNFALDIVQIGKRPVAKKGKMSGEKDIAICASCGRRCLLAKGIHDYTCECGGKMKSVFKKYLRGGVETFKSYPNVRYIRSSLLDSLTRFTGAR